jgi:hypothetical protein
MKSIIPIFLLTLLLISCRTGTGGEEGTFHPDAAYVQIVLFHLAQRCESCMAVENETIRLLEEEYWDSYATGEVKFVSLNYQSESGKQASKLLRAAGQTLYVIKGDSISDLTSPAFMYASTHPEYYREALRTALDKYLQ